MQSSPQRGNLAPPAPAAPPTSTWISPLGLTLAMTGMDALTAAALVCLVAVGAFGIPGVIDSLRDMDAVGGIAVALLLTVGAWALELAYRGLGALIEPWRVRLRVQHRWIDVLAQFGYGAAFLVGLIAIASLLPPFELGTVIAVFGWSAGRGLHQAVLTQARPELLPETISASWRGELGILLALFGLVAATHPFPALVAGLAALLAAYVLVAVAANLLGRYVAMCQMGAFPAQDPAQSRATWRQIAPELWVALGMGTALLALLVLFAMPNLVDLIHQVQTQIAGSHTTTGTKGTPIPGLKGTPINGMGTPTNGEGTPNQGMGTPGAYNGTGTPGGVGIYGSPAPGVTGTPVINSRTPAPGTFGHGGATPTPTPIPTPVTTTSSPTAAFISRDISNILLIVFAATVIALLLLGIVQAGRRFRRRGAQPALVLSVAAPVVPDEPPPPPGTVRATYRALLQAAVDARSDLARRPAETPTAYAARLRAFAATPEGQAALATAGTPAADLTIWLDTVAKTVRISALVAL